MSRQKWFCHSVSITLAALVYIIKNNYFTINTSSRNPLLLIIVNDSPATWHSNQPAFFIRTGWSRNNCRNYIPFKCSNSGLCIWIWRNSSNNYLQPYDLPMMAKWHKFGRRQFKCLEGIIVSFLYSGLSRIFLTGWTILSKDLVIGSISVGINYCWLQSLRCNIGMWWPTLVGPRSGATFKVVVSLQSVLVGRTRLCRHLVDCLVVVGQLNLGSITCRVRSIGCNPGMLRFPKGGTWNGDILVSQFFTFSQLVR